jgi:hypothetical protein
LLEATLGQGNHDRNHKLSNIGSSKKLFYLIIYWEIRLPINQLCLLSQILYESLKPLLTGLSYLEELMTRKKCVLQVEKKHVSKTDVAIMNDNPEKLVMLGIQDARGN